jgi:Protein of unknown function (DUF4065)
MATRFNEAKAAQVAAMLLRLRGTDRMKYLKLIKLMYLIDREALSRWGRTVSTDHHISMDKGPVLSNVYRLITEEPSVSEFWVRHIAQAGDYDVKLVADPGNDELSAVEEALVGEIYNVHGYKNRWQLVEELHNIPEWQDPHGSMIPIDLADILIAVGKDESDVKNIKERLEEEALAMELFQPL